MSSVDVGALGEGLDSLGARALAGRFGEVEQAIRSLEAVAVAIVAVADRGEAYREDGHASVRGWVKASIRTSDAEVTHRVRAAKLVTALPHCHRELAAGRLGVAQVRELARAHANPRCGEQLGAVADELVHLAEVHPHETFVRAVRQWERVADADGAHDDSEHAHRGRRARITAVGDTVYLDARVGTAQGAAMVEVLEQFTQAEFAADWDDLRRRVGDDDCPGRIERTETQRRADALAAVFEAAATTLPDARRPEPVVNIIIDQAVYEAQLAAMTGEDHAQPDPRDLGHQRCRTTSGLPIDHADAVAASLAGWVRRVVLDTDGVIINLGRRCRVFTGSARVAAILQAAIDEAGRCSWPGCGHHRIQIDHSVEWADQGPTDQRNGGPLCPRHNRWKSRGYRTWRDPHGIWHTYRPDGTELIAA